MNPYTVPFYWLNDEASVVKTGLMVNNVSGVKVTKEYSVKTSENDVKHSNFNMGEVDNSQELYSREGDNSSPLEGKTLPWEHSI